MVKNVLTLTSQISPLVNLKQTTMANNIINHLRWTI